MLKSRFLQFFYLLVLLVIVLGSCANDKAILDSKYTISYKSLANVEANLLSLDIYPINSKNTTPVVIWVHGGAWSGGDKKNNIAKKIRLFHSLGYSLVSVNYRLSSSTPAGKKVQHPDHINDLSDAVSWIYKNIDQYNADKTKMVIMGHSAGAQLVALLATDASYLAQRGLSPMIFKGVMSLDTGAYDFTKLLEIGDSQVAKNYKRVFGNSNTVQTSAISYIKNNKSLAQFWLFAERGSKDRKNILANIIELLLAEGVSVSKIDANSLSHAEVNHNIGAPNEKLMTNAIVEFLKTAFK